MEKKQEFRKSHKDRESQKIVDRIEKQASAEAAKAEETRKTLDDYARKVGS